MCVNVFTKLIQQILINAFHVKHNKKLQQNISKFPSVIPKNVKCELVVFPITYIVVSGQKTFNPYLISRDF